MSVQSIELFVLKCAALRSAVEKVSQSDTRIDPPLDGDSHDPILLYIEQFDEEIRTNARQMAEHYRVFYLLENDIRRLISETLSAKHGDAWWDKSVPQSVKDEAAKNRKREEEAGLSIRSERDLDYVTFGQLGDTIRANWSEFAGILSNQAALGRVLFQLNLARGTIAHCGVLAEDEVERLRLTIKDWFSVLAGPS